jgi:5-methylcytosine-specific restriction endonuclease McrA
MRVYQNAWLKNRRNAWLAENGPCRICGSWEQLEVDHIEPLTKEAHRIWGWTAERREAELAKCQALCRACHELKTAREKAGLTVTQAYAILGWYEAGESIRELARRFNTDPKYCDNWRNGISPDAE